MSPRTERPVLFAPLLTDRVPVAPGETPAQAGRVDFERVLGRARSAQEHDIDALLLADRHTAAPGTPDEDAVPAPAFEAHTLASALAVRTESIGLVCGVCTDQLAPYHVARKLATVDHLSGGRAGWLVRDVSAAEAAAACANHRAGGPGTAAERQDRAEEFVTVASGLWDSFQDDAFLRDRADGVYFVPERLHALEHRGPHFDVAGPLNIARPPQGHPILVRPAATEQDARQAAARADVVVVPGDVTGIRQAVREAALAAGRAADDVLVLGEFRTGGHAEADAKQLITLWEAGTADGVVLLPPVRQSAARAADMPGAHGTDEAHTALLAVASAVRTQQTATPATRGTTLRTRLGLSRPPSRRFAP
ncbi:LLM class flavin-dependent oxidoreductase [Streptomyces sp. NPDC001508]|uniref:LLM class flavin-dependent oxidoreductase n=1 Tax=Streptomyces sp. NPDC001508 TaxID=3154656 RepID=UPI003331B6BF